MQREHLTKAEATWEDLTLLSSLYPSLNLEDKVQFDEGDNVIFDGLDSIMVTHERSKLAAVGVEYEGQEPRPSLGRGSRAKQRPKEERQGVLWCVGSFVLFLYVIFAVQ